MKVRRRQGLAMRQAPERGVRQRFTSQLAEQNLPNEPWLEKARAEYHVTLGSRFAQEVPQDDRASPGPRTTSPRFSMPRTRWESRLFSHCSSADSSCADIQPSSNANPVPLAGVSGLADLRD
jgi:hypothetical protein